MAHRSKRISDDEVEYRGFVIRRRDNVTAGYHGRYVIFGNGSFAYLRDAKCHVDKKLDAGSGE